MTAPLQDRGEKERRLNCYAILKHAAAAVRAFGEVLQRRLGRKGKKKKTLWSVCDSEREGDKEREINSPRGQRDGLVSFRRETWSDLMA